MEKVWEIVIEYLGEAIIFIAMILRTARSGTTEEEKIKKKCAKRSAKVVKKLKKIQKDIEFIEANSSTEAEQPLNENSSLCGPDGEPLKALRGDIEWQ